MLRDQGISLIYISHKMDEIFEICDEISVLRDGKLVMTKRTEDKMCIRDRYLLAYVPRTPFRRIFHGSIFLSLKLPAL